MEMKNNSRSISNIGLTQCNVVYVVFFLLFSLFLITQVSHAQDGLVCTTLDDFVNTTIPNRVISLSTPDPAAVNVLDDGSPGVLGGVRNITYGPLTVNMGFFTVTRLSIRLPFLEFPHVLTSSNGVDGFSPFSIVYSANGEGLNLDFSNTEFISFMLEINDNPGDSATYVIMDSNGNSAEYTDPDLPNEFEGDTFPVLIKFMLSEFDGIDSVDLTDIQSIEFKSTPAGFGSDTAFGTLEFCGTPIRNIPTLSEWGLIAMAALLGIVGFMVMRRRKVAA